MSRAATLRLIAGVICSGLFGFLAGMVTDYLTFPQKLTFAQWSAAAPFSAELPNTGAAMAVLLFLAIRMCR